MRAAGLTENRDPARRCPRVSLSLFHPPGSFCAVKFSLAKNRRPPNTIFDFKVAADFSQPGKDTPPLIAISYPRTIPDLGGQRAFVGTAHFHERPCDEDDAARRIGNVVADPGERDGPLEEVSVALGGALLMAFHRERADDFLGVGRRR